MDQILYLAFATLAVLSALLAVTRKNAVAAACWLVAMFFGLAAVFVLLEAYFVATVQILVYAGAIMVLFLFVIMLLDLRTVELASHGGPRMRVSGVLLAGVLLAAIVYAVRDAEDDPRIADRVAVTLTRGAPTPAAAGAPAAATPAPVALVATPATSVAAPDLGAAGEATPGDRRWSGTFRAADGKDAGPERTVDVTVSPEGQATVRVDGKAVPSPAWEPKAVAPTRRATVAVPGAPAGTVLDVVVVRGGLDASPAGGPDGSTYAIGEALFERWLFPFEIAGVLLTGAIFGAVMLTKRRLA